MTTKEILIQARGLVEQGWTQGAFARDVDNNPINALDTDACSWCVKGAMRCVIGYTISEAIDICEKLLYKSISSQFSSVSQFNDYAGTTKSDVIELFDKAIESLE